MRILIFLLCWTVTINAQESPLLNAFQPFIDQTWVAEGQWGDGTPFKQEISFTNVLEGQIIIATSLGFVDQAQTQWGERNHGIRKWDDSCQCIKFWEYDVFGGITEGKIEIKGGNLYYAYEYEGTMMTDAWEKKDDSSYDFIVGIMEDGGWKQKFLETEFRSLPQFTGSREDLDQILKNTAGFSQAYMNEDHEAVASFYTEDGKIMPNGTRIIAGREAIASRWKLPEGTQIHHHQVTPIEINIMGDTATDYGYYQGSSQNPGQEISNWKGKYVIIWKKVDGEWLIDVDICNRVN